MDMPATASCTAWRPYCRWLEMAMIEPITGKVVKMPDQWVPSAAENWVMTTVSDGARDHARRHAPPDMLAFFVGRLAARISRTGRR